MSAPIRLAVVGLGKIAQDQHLPAIAADPAFVLAATVSRQPGGVAGVPHFAALDALAAGGVAVDAVALCTPPQVRRPLAAEAIGRGWHVFLEKPPAATLAEATALRDLAAARGVGLFASWHSRQAAGVEPARAWLAGRTVRRATITWREDVRHWHPGQDWLWEPGGFGVFDPGINALSIATRILPHPLFVEAAEVDVPANRAAPIAARIALRDTAGAAVAVDFDFRQEGPQSWDIGVDTDDGTLALGDGGARLAINGVPVPDLPAVGEYPGLYRRFAEVVRSRASDVDLAPLRLVADSFLRARLALVEPFLW